MNQRKIYHIETVGRCRKYKEGQCPFSSKHCWWKHDELIHESKELKCIKCNNVFETKSNLMCHIKESHSSAVPACKQFENGDCKFNEKFCWFRHVNKKQELDFHKTAENLDPPLIL